MITIIAFVIMLSFLVFVHELGHFITAKKVGIVVEEFAIGFPPRAVKLWQDEGKLGLDEQKYIIGRKTDVPKGLEIGSDVYVQTEPRANGQDEVTHIEIVDPDESDDTKSSTRVTYLEKPTEYVLNWIPFGGYVKMLGEEDPTAPGSFASKSKTARLIVLSAGSVMNLIAAVVIFTIMFMTGSPEPIGETFIADIAPNSPAEQVGIQINDIIFQVDDVVVETTSDVANYTQTKRGQEITLKILRNESELQISLVPRVNSPPGEGAMGIAIQTRPIGQRITKYSIGEAFVKATSATVNIAISPFLIPVAIMRKTISAEDARPVGPVGIYDIAGSAIGETVAQGVLYPILLVTALISAALAVTNLLPIPALDGGRIMFIIIEAIRGRRISPEKEGAVHLIGLAFLMVLMVVITIYDVSNPIDVPDWSNMFGIGG